MPIEGLNDLLAGLTGLARAQLGHTPVAVRGSRVIGARLGYYETELRDGTLGYGQRRADDCLRAAISTLLQIPMPDVPDLRLDRDLAAGKDPDEISSRAWTTLDGWADTRGLTIMIHPSPPVSERRWIGIVPDAGVFNDHSLVMNRREILHDPGLMSHHLPGLARRPAASDIDYGITIRKE